MTVLRLAASELKRMTSGILPKLTIIALIMVPLLYGAVYLYANWDPYANLDEVSAAVVVQDVGATTSAGERLDVGHEVARNLIDGEKFHWQQVLTPEEANDGVRNGDFAFALIIPADFSANLASPENFDAARQAMLSVTTNDANNYLLTSIVDKVTTQVHASVAEQVGEQTANSLLSGYGTIHGQLVQAADGATALREGATTLDTGMDGLLDGSGSLVTGTEALVAGQGDLVAGSTALAAGSSSLNEGLAALEQQTRDLPASTRSLATGAATVASGSAALSTGLAGASASVDAMDATLSTAISDKLGALVAAGTLTPEQGAAVGSSLKTVTQTPAIAGLQTQLGATVGISQQLATGAQSVSDGAATLAAATPTLSAAIGQAHAGAVTLSTGADSLAVGQTTALAGAQQLASGTAGLAAGAGELKEGATRLVDGATELSTELGNGAAAVPNPSDAAKASTASVIADPVRVESASQAQAANYGSGLAPFFLVLALWIGAFMLVQAMRPLTVRALASTAPSWKIALGGWLPFATVAAAQAALLYAVVRFGLGLEPAHPWLTVALLLLASCAFSALIQGIVALLGTPGKFVVLVLLVLQLVSSGGTFPWQTTPGPLHLMHHILPMGHVVEGMRHLIYGADLAALTPIVAGLLGYLVLGLLLGWVAVLRHKTWTLKTLLPEIAV